ncbi:hypothetical protein MASR1M68_12510 [Elusimicrobiota bacterium]
MKKAVITGITGQDGSYLAELLLEKNYEVHGIVRRSSSPNLTRIEHIINNPEFCERLFLHFGDLSDSLSLTKTICKVGPDEVYNLAAQSQVYVSFDIPEYTGEVSGLASVRLLEAINICKSKTKYFQACSSEIFGNPQESPQNENTHFKTGKSLRRLKIICLSYDYRHTVQHTICLTVAEYYITMKAREDPKVLLQEK